MPRHRIVVATLGTKRESLSDILSTGDHRVAHSLHWFRQNFSPAVATDGVFDGYVVGQNACFIDEFQLQRLASGQLCGNFAKFQMMLTRPLRAAKRRD